MAAWLDTGWLRLVGYLAAALTAVIAGWREHKHTNVEPDLWPSFWFLTAGLFAAMAVGRATDLGYLATQLGRSQARSQGWYVNRRKA